MSTTITTTSTATTPPASATPTSARIQAKGTPKPVATLDSTSPDYREIRRRVHHEADIVIVGAGIVGCSAAVAFAKQGRSVILLERSLKEPDRIVGELLQPGGLHALDKLGLKHCTEGIDAVPCYGYYVSYHGEPVHIPYPTGLLPSSSDDKAPEGVCFHHGRFIQKLREAARETPNVTLVETTVTNLVKSEYTNQIVGVETTTAGKQDCYFGALTLVADGYASKFRKEAIPHTPQVRSKFWALELIDAEVPMPYHGHVILSDAPPILIYQIGTHETRILIDIPEGLPSASLKAGGVKNHLLNVALPTVPECVRPSLKKAIEGGKLRSMPNSFLPAASQKTPGLIILGDAMNMRHPLTGGGMTVAFNDVLVLSELLAPSQVPDFEDSAAVVRSLQQFHWKRKNGSSVINILAMALYSLFAANSPALTALKNGCFRYFQLGGKRISEPCGMLGGMIKTPSVLVYHFFSVAFYGVWCRMLDGPVWRIPYVMFIESIIIIYTAAVTIGPYLLCEIRQ